MNILVACEESQRVCMAFRAKGHRAFSCDIIECSGGHPEWHIKADVLPLLNGNCKFKTSDGKKHTIEGKWDMIIAHPPCTFLSIAGQRCFSPKQFTYKQIYERSVKRTEAVCFFVKFLLADCDKIAIENPVGYINTHLMKPAQIIHPWQFAESEESDEYVTKRTCLWLKGLPTLKQSNNLAAPVLNKKLREDNEWGNKYKYDCWTERCSGSINRAKTFHCIANAMAKQWG